MSRVLREEGHGEVGKSHATALGPISIGQSILHRTMAFAKPGNQDEVSVDTTAHGIVQFGKRFGEIVNLPTGLDIEDRVEPISLRRRIERTQRPVVVNGDTPVQRIAR